MALKVCIVQLTLDTITETFIRAHAERLPADVTVVHRMDGLIPAIEGKPVLSRVPRGSSADRSTWPQERCNDKQEIIAGYLEAFRRSEAQVVLAEYGPIGVAVHEACQIAGIPFVVHFHGYDASRKDIIDKLREPYQRMFQDARAVIAVSRSMHGRLLAWGANPQRTHLNVYGIDCGQFKQGRPEKSTASFLAVGRFVEKKAPDLTVLAFGEMLRQVPTARLRMIGNGPLLGACKDLAADLGICHAVDFLGPQPHEVVATEMRNARAFVQHSVEATNGDSEGTPLAILEAGATGLPVVSTKHGGIPDVVVDGKTGFLVDEKDVSLMAKYMIDLALDPGLAGRLGNSGRSRVACKFTIERSIAQLYAILKNAAAKGPPGCNSGLATPFE